MSADDAGDGWFAVVDAAQDPRLYGLIKSARSNACLFSGKLSYDLAAASPHVVRLRPEEPLLEAWRTAGAGKNWGIMCRSVQSLDYLRKHFRKFLQAKLPDGMIAMFRFYDPRVFNTYIRAAMPEERKPWFDGIGVIAVEGAPGKVHNYHMRGDRLFDADVSVD